MPTILPSFRRRPESRFSKHKLDPGLRRDDGAFKLGAQISFSKGKAYPRDYQGRQR